MSALKDIIIRQIRADEPISIADYMTLCLLHPDHGYYATRDPFGQKGDFITAPEISQMFGEVLGLCLAQAWMDQGSPDKFHLCELGPGRGTLMRDMLRACEKVPGFTPQLHLVEASATLRDIQQDTLRGYDVNWHNSVDDLPDGPVFLIANEFFDALPIRQFIRAGDGWCERRIGVKGDTLEFGLSDATSLDIWPHADQGPKHGDLVEICPSARAIVAAISTRIKTHGGAAIFIDYGDWRSLGDTFQALGNHTPTDPLANPGNADLTAHVDFAALAQAANCNVTAMTPQGALLERLGITARAQALAKGLSGEALDAHISAHRRLTHPAEMGSLFKAIALYPEGVAPPPGFDI